MFYLRHLLFNLSFLLLLIMPNPALASPGVNFENFIKLSPVPSSNSKEGAQVSWVLLPDKSSLKATITTTFSKPEEITDIPEPLTWEYQIFIDDFLVQQDL